jgi:hypothetical protein
VCAPPGSTEGGSADAGPGSDGATHVDGGAHDDTGSGPDGGGVPGCLPNDSGTITRAEVPMMAGLHANFVIAENVMVDSAGTTNPDGSRTWDLSGALSGDHVDLVTTDSPSGQWFSAQVTSATYTTKLSDTSTNLAVFQASDTALLLQAVVSPTGGSGSTEELYSPAAEVLAVPMQLGTAWNSTSTVQGTDQGFDSIYTETYASKIDAYGSMKVPYGTFPVLRVQTTLTRTVGVVVTVTQSLTFVAQCFGPVAALTSQTGETNTEFTNAAEARRLTP